MLTLSKRNFFIHNLSKIKESLRSVVTVRSTVCEIVTVVPQIPIKRLNLLAHLAYFAQCSIYFFTLPMIDSSPF